MSLNKKSPLATLMEQFPNHGTVTWIGIRPERRKEVIKVEKISAIAGKGLEGDHYSGAAGARQITLFQYEHLAVIASVLNKDRIDPSLLRRNIVVKGINLLSLKEKKFRIGEVLLEMSGLCHPCSRMEEVLGPGGYNAVRGHGGITARILESGIISMGDKVIAENY